MAFPKKKVYIETTIPSVITARPSRDIRNLYRQQISKEFWEYERHKYDLYISEYVLRECKKGDKNAANRRLELLKDIQFLYTSEDVEKLAEEYFRYLNIPQRAKTDCFHLAISVVEKMDYLMSWVAFRLPKMHTPDAIMDLEKEEAQNGV
jgi:hypothetical protein